MRNLPVAILLALTAMPSASQNKPDLVTMRPAQLNALDPLAGEWEGSATVYATPTSPKTTAPLSASFRWVLRTYHLDGILKYRLDDRPIEVHLLLTYAWNKRVYQAYWADDFSSIPVLYTGAVRNGVLVLSGFTQQEPKPLKQQIRLTLTPGQLDLVGSAEFDGDWADRFKLQAKRKK